VVDVVLLLVVAHQEVEVAEMVDVAEAAVEDVVLLVAEVVAELLAAEVAVVVLVAVE